MHDGVPKHSKHPQAWQAIIHKIAMPFIIARQRRGSGEWGTLSLVVVVQIDLFDYRK